jgi:hypothetical protein
MNRRLMIALAVLVTLLGFALRLYKISNQSLWTDEIYSLATSRVPLAEITTASAVTNNSLPTYFLLLRLVVGDSHRDIEFRARLISVLAGTFSIPLFIGLACLWRHRMDVGLMAGLLLAINPLHIWYSQETRAYALMLFFGLLSLLSFEIARQRRHRWAWAAYIVSALAAVALHKTAIIFPAVCFLCQAWELRREPSRMPILLVHLGIFVIAVTALCPKSYPPSAEYGRHSSGLEILYTLITYTGGYSFGPSLTQIQTYGPWGAASRHPAELAAAAAVLLLIALNYSRNIRSLSSAAAALFFLDLSTVSAYSALSGFPYNVRYALPALIGYLALVADLPSRHNHLSLARATLAAVAALSLWADWQWYYSPIYRKEDSRAVAQWLIENEDAVGSWTVLPGYSAEPLLWYLDNFGHPELVARLEPSQQNETTSFPPVPDVLITGRHDRIKEPGALIAAYRTAAGSSREIDSFAGFQIFVRIPPKAPPQ